MRKVKEIATDYLTMIAAYLRIKGEHKCLLESIPRDKNQGRYSIIALNPVQEITYQNGELKIGKEVTKTKDPLAAIEQMVIQKNPMEQGLPFEAGIIGYVGFDVFGLYEDIGQVPYDEMGIPDIHFYLFESFLVFDHINEKMMLVQDNVYSGRSEKELDAELVAMEKQLKESSTEEQKELKIKRTEFTSNCTKDEYMSMVRVAKKYIQEGDIFQMVPSQRLTCQLLSDPFDYYRKLRHSNPSSYLYYLDFGRTKVIGSSPESLVSVKGDVVQTNPIAGTRQRGQNALEDQELAYALQTDEKELAEHRMLVDLGRNDLGKIAEIGSVHVPIYLTIEKYQFVMHLVSVVAGKLKQGYSTMDALRATLPAGTVSGAPKIRAIKRIYEVEKVKRTIYAGAVGYLTKQDQGDFAIAIRTMVVCGQTAYVQAGAGIVYDSDPEQEYEETLHKARALLEVGE